MRFVEQEEPGAAGQRHGQARPALLAGGQPTEGHAGEAGESEFLEHGVGLGDPAAAGPDPEAHVLPDGEVVVGAGGVTDESQFGADGVAVGGEVVAEDDGNARREREEAGHQPQERCLPRAVGPGHQHHFALGHVEVDAGQRRVAAEEADGGTEMDGGMAQIDSILPRGGRIALGEEGEPPKCTNRKRHGR
ncbi:MAG: hypothetical protein QOI86_3567 [Actinomycetota bacterium]|nr:hypothetical protein [Actinomycetota bacterium]